jgi:hypothetical protein
VERNVAVVIDARFKSGADPLKQVADQTKRHTDAMRAQLQGLGRQLEEATLPKRIAEQQKRLWEAQNGHVIEAQRRMEKARRNAAAYAETAKQSFMQVGNAVLNFGANLAVLSQGNKSLEELAKTLILVQSGVQALSSAREIFTSVFGGISGGVRAVIGHLRE